MTAEQPDDQYHPHPGDVAEATPSLDRLERRLQRLEQQLRSFRDLHTAELGELAEKLQALARLHADELQLLLAELADITAELGRQRGGALRRAEAEPGEDPAAASPKRARWLAEEARRMQPQAVSRRDLLLGRRDSS